MAGIKGMTAVILAGGFGTRITEETAVRPKPMVEIGGKPILWHIMKGYSFHGITRFIVLVGYRGDVIRQFFANYHLSEADVTFDLERASAERHSASIEPWQVTVVETGLEPLTGGRLLRARRYLESGTFCLTYGDCVSDVDMPALVDYHRSSGAEVTLTAVQPPGRFGAIRIAEGGEILSFQEKPKGDGAWVNGGFFVVEPSALDAIDGDDVAWEGEPLQRIARRGGLRAYQHTSYWQNLDTLRDKAVLEAEWASESPGWKLW